MTKTRLKIIIEIAAGEPIIVNDALAGMPPFNEMRGIAPTDFEFDGDSVKFSDASGASFSINENKDVFKNGIKVEVPKVFSRVILTQTRALQPSKSESSRKLGDWVLIDLGLMEPKTRAKKGKRASRSHAVIEPIKASQVNTSQPPYQEKSSAKKDEGKGVQVQKTSPQSPTAKSKKDGKKPDNKSLFDF
jgi:hypothetical protein